MNANKQIERGSGEDPNVLVIADESIGVVIPARRINTAYQRPILWLRNARIATILAIKYTTIEVMKHQRKISTQMSKPKQEKDRSFPRRLDSNLRIPLVDVSV